MKLADYLLDNPLYAYGSQIRQQGSQTTPVLSWQEGLARALQGGVGGFFQGQAKQQAEGERTTDNQALADALGKFGQGDLQGATATLATRPNLSDTTASLGMQAGMLNYKQKLENDLQDADFKRFGISAPGQQTAAMAGGAGAPGAAIAGIESQGQPNGGYGAVGPVANQQGNRAYGKYQVLDSNIPTWTKEVLGQEMTPQQFLQSPQAQDAVFKTKFGQYTQQYGSPEAAARAWFAGPGGMNNPNAQDVNGMTVGQYGQKFSATVGGQPAAQGSDTINFQGIPVPKAALAGALMIRDHAERQKAVSAVVNNAVKFQQEGAPVERVRDADGNEHIVTRAQAVGRVSQQNVTPPGSIEGDVNLLTRGIHDPQIAASPEYAAAHARVASKLSEGAQGQKMAPNMSMFPPPTGAAPPAAGQGPGGATMVGQPVYNEAQSKAQQYVTQLNNAIPLLEREISDGRGGYTTERLPGNFAQTASRSDHYPESMVSEGAKKYRQIANDIMTATLRQTSGATIKPEEFTAEAQKYIPQPGDTSEIIAQKLKALKLFAVAMAGETGKDVGSYPALSEYAKNTQPTTSHGRAGIPAPPAGFRVLP